MNNKRIIHSRHYLAVAGILGILASAPAYSTDAPTTKNATTSTPSTTKGGLPPASVKFYGVVDVGVNRTNSGYGAKTRLDGGGGWSQSRVGVKITRDIGHGLRAVGVLEGGVQFLRGVMGRGPVPSAANVSTPSSSGLDASGVQIFARQAFGGVEGKFGSLTVGRQYTGSYYGAAVVGEAHSSGLYGNGITFLPHIGGMPARMSNSVVYKTPKYKGLYGWGTVFTGSQNNVNGPTVVGATTTTDAAGRGYDLAAIYSSGPFGAVVSTWQANNDSWVTAGETGLAKKRGYQLAANYDFGPVQLFADYVNGKISGGNYQNVTKVLSSASGYAVSVLVPFGNNSFYVSYTKLDDKSSLNRSGKLFGVGYWYSLSKDARVYVSWGEMKNNENAGYALADAGNLVGNVAKPGTAVTGAQAGVNFSF